jgi:spermidine synthase
MRGLCLVALAAASLLAVVPFAADPLLDVAVDALDEISAGAFIGSLVGTLLSALVLIPLVGTRRTFLVFALAIAVVAVLGLRPVRRWAAAPAVIAALIALPVGTLKAKTDSDAHVIHEAETEYQYARVLQYDDGSRTLELNEGQAQHSVCEAECDAGPAGPGNPSSVLTGDVWDGHLVDHFAGRSTPPRRMAILGNAAGTTSRAYEEFFPRTRVDGVEVDAELSEIGRRYFDMNNPRLHLYHEDARPFLRRIDARYDVISVDAYRQPYIPFYLTTREFFELCQDRLTDGGTVIVNVGHPEGSDELEKVLGATMGDVFADVARDPVDPTNTLVLASDTAISADRVRRAGTRFPHELEPLVEATASKLAPALEGGEVYTDDKAPVEWLVDKSIVEYAADDGD